MSKPKVLIVEDEVRWSHVFKALLQNDVEVIIAFTIQSAEELFREHSSDLVVILMDAQMDAFAPNTMELTRTFRQSFAGPMIAMSSLHANLQLLREAGCDYEAEKDKAVEKLREILGLS
ncbi:MAG: hypothetical protein Q7S63_00215 [bacterium]|nr:hypothetical protein [bacterium]